MIVGNYCLWLTGSVPPVARMILSINQKEDDYLKAIQYEVRDTCHDHPLSQESHLTDDSKYFDMDTFSKKLRSSKPITSICANDFDTCAIFRRLEDLEYLMSTLSDLHHKEAAYAIANNDHLDDRYPSCHLHVTMMTETVATSSARQKMTICTPLPRGQ